MEVEGLSKDQRDARRAVFKEAMAAENREKRRRYRTRDFHSLAVVGRGAFGEVHLVRRADTGALFALKMMRKEAMVRENQVAHVLAERDILAAAENPWIVHLQFSFHDAEYLYLGLEFLPGGDLMGLLIK